MRLTLVDRILELQPGRNITVVKSLSLTEEYLRDHFPYFPVMPGVLMLEVMYQAAAWLVRTSDQFGHSMVTLGEANNVKYSDFVEPGQTLRVEAALLEQQENRWKMKCQGSVEGKVAVRARLLLDTWNLADQQPEQQATDQFVIARFKEKLDILYADQNPSE